VESTLNPENLAVTLNANMLATLPEELRCELKDALESLDSECIEAIIEQVKPLNAALYDTLNRCAINLDYASILKALLSNESS
jgi:hypothetical protein